MLYLKSIFSVYRAKKNRAKKFEVYDNIYLQANDIPDLLNNLYQTVPFKRPDRYSVLEFGMPSNATFDLN